MEDSKHTIGSVAREAARLQIRPTVQPNELRQDIENSMIQVAESDNLSRLSKYLRLGKLKATHWLHGAPYDADLKDLDHTDPMWVLNGGQREMALELLGVLVKSTRGSVTLTVLQHVDKHQADLAAALERQTKRGYFLDEAAQSIADQQGESPRWAAQLLRNMQEAAALPADNPIRLRVRDTATGIVEPKGTTQSRIVLVRPIDVNDWLEAQDETYRWTPPTSVKSYLSNDVSSANGRKWTPDKLTELATFRKTHTMPETAAKFGISEQRIRHLLPTKKPKAKVFQGLLPGAMGNSKGLRHKGS